MTKKSNEPAAPKSTGMNKEGLGLALFALVALVIVSVAGYTVFATDSDGNDFTNDSPVVFIDGDFKFQVLSETDKTVGLVANAYDGIIEIPETATNSETSKTYTVTKIMDRAFYGSTVTNVKIAKNVTSIDSTAFLNCPCLLAISVADGNQYFSVDDYGVLYNVDKTTFLKYPEAKRPATFEYTVAGTVTTIASYSFSGNLEINKIIMGPLTQKIDNRAFYDNKTLVTIDMTTHSTSLTSIGEYAFSGCSSLGSLTTPSSIKSIGAHAFSDCSSLVTATINSIVESFAIGEYAFSGCSALKTISFPATLTSFNEGVFQNCSSLESFNVPKNITSIHEKTFLGCTGIKKFTVESGNSNFKGMSDSLYTTSNYLVAYPGGKIHKEMFDLNSNTVKILPYAFSSCMNNFSVSIENCSKLTEIGDYAFYASAIDTVWGHNNVAKIGDYAFYECKHLVGVDVDYGDIKSIGEYAFYGCEKFYHFGTKLGETGFVIPDSVNSIADTAFIGCKAIKSFYVDGGSSFKSVNHALFTHNMGRLIAYPLGSTATTFTIPKETTFITEFAFVGAMNLTTINVDADNPNYYSADGVLYNKDKSELLQYPCGRAGEYEVLGTTTTISAHSFALSKIEGVKASSLKTIGDYAFYNCTGLKYAEMTRIVESIGDYAFSGCINLGSTNKTLTIGARVTNLGVGAFENCTTFVNLEMLSDNPISLKKQPFMGCNLDYIFVPNYSIGKYKSAEIYKDYSDYIFSVVSDLVPAGGFVYDGNEHTCLFDDKFIITGQTAVDAGDYIASITPKFDEGFVWDMNLAHGAHAIQWGIEKCTLGYVDVTAETKQYDGTTEVKGGSIVFSNIPERGCAVQYSADFNYASKDAGPWAINVTGIKLLDDSARNYKLTDDKFTSASKFEIEKYRFSIDESYSKDFDNKNSYTVSNVPTGVGSEKITVTYTTTSKNAGIYSHGAAENGFTLTYTDGGKQNYAITGAVDFTIYKIQYDMSKISFKDASCVYDAKYHNIRVTGEIPKGLDGSSVKISYSADLIDVPGGEIIATFTTDSPNYYIVTPTMKATLTITGKPLDLDARQVVYDNKTEYKFDIAGLSGETITLRYYGTSYFNAGTYKWNDGFKVDYKSDDGKKNYVINSVKDLTVLKADYDMSEITFEGESVVYDGQTHSIYVYGVLPTGLDGIKVQVSYNSNEIKDVGSVRVIAVFSTESVNYNEPDSMTATITVTPFMLNIGPQKVYFNGEKTFVIEDYETGVGEEKITLTYTTTSYVPGTYKWHTGFEITYEQGVKRNYDFNTVGDLTVDTQEVVVTFDPDYGGVEPKVITLTWNEGKYKVDRTKLPTVQGQVNLGWYDADGYLVDFDDYFLEDATYKAKWQAAQSDMVIVSYGSNVLDIDLKGQDSVRSVQVDFAIGSIILDVMGLSNRDVITVSFDNATSNGESFKLTITSKNGWFNEAVTVALPYDVYELHPAVVYHYVDGEKVDMGGIVDEDDGVIMFLTDEYDGDVYGVEYLHSPASSGSNMMMIVLAAVGIILIAGCAVAFVFIRRY